MRSRTDLDESRARPDGPCPHRASGPEGGGDPLRPGEGGGSSGGASCRDFDGIVPASQGPHCRPLHPRLASLCSGQHFVHNKLISYYNTFAIPGARSRACRHDEEEVTQVEIESGTQVASRGPTWRIATPRY